MDTTEVCEQTQSLKDSCLVYLARPLSPTSMDFDVCMYRGGTCAAHQHLRRYSQRQEQCHQLVRLLRSLSAPGSSLAVSSWVRFASSAKVCQANWVLPWPEGQLQPAAVKLFVLETANADNCMRWLDETSICIASKAQSCQYMQHVVPYLIYAAHQHRILLHI